jgi:chemotaxis protein MotB
MQPRAALVLLMGLGLGSCGGNKPPAEPRQDDRVKALEAELATTKDELAKANAATEEAKQAEGELKAKADEASALQQKLADAVGGNGEVTTADGAVKLELVDQILFPTGEADLTPSGKDVLGKVGAALKEIGDKQIWVQGHTDDQPIFARKPKPAELAKARPAKPVKGKPGKPDPKGKPPETNDAVLPFVTNWELSAARALTVVHYLQDDAKIEPTRLAAVAFGQYRPVSKAKAKNRRIEIVLYPRAKIAPR